MSLRSPTEHENGGISLHMIVPSTRHSRASAKGLGRISLGLTRESRFVLRRISLDTRSPIKVGDKLRGYDGTQRLFRSADHSRTCILEGGRKDTKVSDIELLNFVPFVVNISQQ